MQHHQQFLGFSRLFSHGARRYVTFKVLPFGLSTACFVFTKLLRPLVTRWQSMGHVFLVYIDDVTVYLAPVIELAREPVV